MGLAKLQNANVSLASLPSAELGLEYGNSIVIDTDAAGYGWFVDATPLQDEEFGPSNGGLIASSRRCCSSSRSTHGSHARNGTSAGTERFAIQ